MLNFKGLVDPIQVNVTIQMKYGKTLAKLFAG